METLFVRTYLVLLLALPLPYNTFPRSNCVSIPLLSNRNQIKAAIKGHLVLLLALPLPHQIFSRQRLREDAGRAEQRVGADGGSVHQH